MKEIIQAKFGPLIYDKSKYIIMKYYSVSNISNYNAFEDISIIGKKKKYYALIIRNK